MGVGQGERDRSALGPIKYHCYENLTGPPQALFPPLIDLGDHVRRGLTVADLLLKLRASGFQPDAVIAHPSWGDFIFAQDIFPDAKRLAYLEYYYRPSDSDIDFDPEFAAPEADRRFTRLRNISNLLAFAGASQCVSPTAWQAGLFPTAMRDRIEVVHEGIDTNAAAPNSAARYKLPNGSKLTRKDEVITYVARSLEPYRGFHIFMRALPKLLARRPTAQVLIAGADSVSYGRRPPTGESWRKVLLRELDDNVGMDRVHFLGTLTQQRFLKLLQVSRLHVYLTYPFVLSWSLLEAMACACPVLASRTGPVLEVIEDGKNGRLVDFFDAPGLVEAASALLDDEAERMRLGAAARETVVERFDFKTACLPRYLSLLQ